MVEDKARLDRFEFGDVELEAVAVERTRRAWRRAERKWAGETELAC